MSESEPEPEKANSQHQLYEKIGTLLLNGLRLAEKWLDNQTTNLLMQRLNDIPNATTALQQIEYFIFVLLNKIETLSQSATMTLENQDYNNLEAAVQKAEAEIRTHVRIEQQLKIYAEGMEERMEQLETQLQLQTEKYHKLYETAKLLDSEKKELRRKIKIYELKIKSIQEKGNLNQKNSKMLSESSFHCSQSSIEKIYLEKGRTRVKQFINQSSEKKYRKQTGSDFNPHPHKNKRLNSEIDLSAVHLESKKEEGMTEPKSKCDGMELTETMRLKDLYRKNQPRLGKYLKNSTEDTGKRRETRSNSVCS